MRERLDCAVLGTACTDEWVRHWQGTHMGGRLNVQSIADPPSIGEPDSSTLLAESAMVLRRYDVCLIPVAPSNLAWVRTALQAARGRMHTPLLAIVRELRAAALDDLFRLGLADFMRDPVCFEELRARVEHLLEGGSLRNQLRDGPGLRVSEGGAPHGDLCDNSAQRSGHELDAYAQASTSRCAVSRESFKTAKSKVIERFERAYITAALGRHSGNIAMAARAAQKHRRAFWALMRKHQIDAAPFREPPQNRPGRG